MTELLVGKIEMSLTDLEYLSAMLGHKNVQQHWAPSYKDFVTSLGARVDAEIERIKIPYEEAEILRKADAIRARRALDEVKIR